MNFKAQKIGYIDRLNFYKSNFRKSVSFTETVSFDFNGINGSSTKNGFKNSLKAAMGEHIERVSLYKNSDNIKKKEVIAFNILMNRVEYIPNKYVSLSIMEDDLEKLNENYYNDSSGVASELKSNLVLMNSLFEFIERQSIVFSFLTKTPATEIVIKKNMYTENNLYLIANNYYDHIKIYNITIFEGIHVILSIGFGKYYGIGLSANIDKNRAINKSLEELISCSYFHLPKEYTQQEIKKTKTPPDLKIENKLDDAHFYSEMFFSHFSSEKLKKAFAYLSHGKKECLDEKIMPGIMNIDPIAIAGKIAKMYNFNIYIIYIPARNIKFPNKIVKFFSPNCYPHINTMLLNPNKYAISFIKKRDQKFPNIYRYLPFP